MELLTAIQARQIAENTIVKNNIEYILKKIRKEANKGEGHIYIHKTELVGNTNIEKITLEQIQKLEYNVFLSCDVYKIAW